MFTLFAFEFYRMCIVYLSPGVGKWCWSVFVLVPWSLNECDGLPWEPSPPIIWGKMVLVLVNTLS